MEKYFDASYIWSAFPQLLPYLKVTFFVTIVTILIGTLLGIVLAMMKLQSNRVLQMIAAAYTTVMRCTPAVVMLFLVYYGIPKIAEGLFGLNLNDVHIGFYVITTFVLMYAAMMSEVIRSAIEAVDKGQYEAAVSVGLSPVQAYIRIIIPQAFLIAIPNIGNGVIAVLQEGALAYTIGFVDVVGKANLIISTNYGTHALEIYIALTVIYWVLTIVLEKIFAMLENVFVKGKRTLKTS